MPLLDGLRGLAERRRELLGEEDPELQPFALPVEEVCSATLATLAGRPIVMAGTNNYLGLTFDPDCRAAGREAIDRWGTGTTGSRMANGSYAPHLELERELADFFERREAIVFSTGYQANLGIISAVLGRGDVAMLDGDCHASILDGATLSGADVLRFRHGDPASLERRLRRLGERTERTLVIVEGLYSMLGDRAPLARIVELKREYGFSLLVDEAHSLGVLGAGGRGLAEEAEVEEEVDFVVGTFSKSLGGIGGFAVSDHPEFDLIRYASRPYIFTASPPPSSVAATRSALHAIRTRPELRERLWASTRSLHTHLCSLGYRLGPEVSPILAVHLSTPAEGLEFWQGLLEHGVYVNLMLPPATPNGEALVRCSVTAAHTDAELEQIRAAFTALAQ